VKSRVGSERGTTEDEGTVQFFPVSNEEQRKGGAKLGFTKGVAIFFEIIQERLSNLIGSPLRTTLKSGSHPEQRVRNSPLLGCSVAEKVRMVECSGD
jgi:hypothetical protein